MIILCKNKRIKTYFAFVFISLFTLTFFNNCDTTEPPQNDVPDTTSQNFTFESFEFGDGYESSYFNDVWIFDENNIWAVGYIGTGTVTNANIMRWNGQEWYIEDFQGTSSGIKGIWALDSSNIYFASGGLRRYKDGKYSNIETNVGLTQFQGIYKLWGSSESNIWGVGPWGTIVHFDGNEWEKIDFATEWYFDNITGSKESGVAYATASKTGDVVIIAEMRNKQVKIIYRSDENTPQLKSWTIRYFNEGLYLGRSDLVSTKLWRYDLVTGRAIVLKDLLNTPLQMSVAQLTLNDTNNAFYFGKHEGKGMMIHYNGVRYSGFAENIRPSDNYSGAHNIENLCVSVGWFNNKAYITMIRRE